MSTPKAETNKRWVSTKNYRDHWDAIFRREKEPHTSEAPTPIETNPEEITMVWKDPETGKEIYRHTNKYSFSP